MKKFFFYIGNIISFFYPIRFGKKYNSIKDRIYSGYMSRFFQSMSNTSIIEYRFQRLEGSKYIRIGKNVRIDKNTTLTAWDSYKQETFSPLIILEDGVAIGANAHITCINKVVIGKNVLLGKNVLITDNSHGNLSVDENRMVPLDRPLYSKGPVIIEDNVWIGEKTSILPNVTIGHGAIIAANSVVTKNVPPNCLIAGCPAKIIRFLK